MKTAILAAGAAAALAVGGVSILQAQARQGQTPPAIPGQLDKSRITAGTYTADSAHSLVAWSVDHLGFNDYYGLLGDVSGTLTLDPARPAEAKVDVRVPVAKVVVASEGLRDHLLRPGKDGAKPDFFGPNPAEARFVSTKVTPESDGSSAKVAGNLTLNGVTKPVTLNMRFTGAGANPMSKAETVGFEGQVTIKRSEFGIAYGIPMVSDEVLLMLTAAFEKTSG